MIVISPSELEEREVESWPYELLRAACEGEQPADAAGAEARASVCERLEGQDAVLGVEESFSSFLRREP